jgi:hypothetical protein
MMQLQKNYKTALLMMQSQQQTSVADVVTAAPSPLLKSPVKSTNKKTENKTVTVPAAAAVSSVGAGGSKKSTTENTNESSSKAPAAKRLKNNRGVAKPKEAESDEAVPDKERETKEEDEKTAVRSAKKRRTKTINNLKQQKYYHLRRIAELQTKLQQFESKEKEPTLTEEEKKVPNKAIEETKKDIAKEKTELAEREAMIKVLQTEDQFKSPAEIKAEKEFKEMCNGLLTLLKQHESDFKVNGDEKNADKAKIQWAVHLLTDKIGSALKIKTVIAVLGQFMTEKIAKQYTTFMTERVKQEHGLTLLKAKESTFKPSSSDDNNKEKNADKQKMEWAIQLLLHKFPTLTNTESLIAVMTKFMTEAIAGTPANKEWMTERIKQLRGLALLKKPKTEFKPSLSADNTEQHPCKQKIEWAIQLLVDKIAADWKVETFIAVLSSLMPESNANAVKSNTTFITERVKHYQKEKNDNITAGQQRLFGGGKKRSPSPSAEVVKPVVVVNDQPLLQPSVKPSTAAAAATPITYSSAETKIGGKKLFPNKEEVANLSLTKEKTAKTAPESSDDEDEDSSDEEEDEEEEKEQKEKAKKNKTAAKTPTKRGGKRAVGGGRRRK